MARRKRSPIPPLLHALESMVMEELWRRDQPTTVRTVMEALNRRGATQRAHTTVMTTMHRLEQKGLLTRRREGQADLYSPRLSRQEYRDARVEAGVSALVDEYGEAALVHFARRIQRLDRERREQLRRLAGGDS